MKRRSVSFFAATGYVLACIGALGPSRADAQSSVMLSTDFIEDGQPVALEMVVHRPTGAGPFPTLLFTHGSVGNGNDPKEVAFSAGYPELARYFTDQGWLVAVLQRRGRGRSGGRYAEGWQPDRGRYACEPALARAGLQRAIDDMDIAATQLLAWPDVDRSQLLIGGHSKGGLLAMAYAARQPGRFRGVLNFVGGWVGERCEFAEQINTPAFAAAATIGRPTLWLYGERDPYYSIAHSRKNFEAYRAAGGQGAFEVLSLGPLRNDHQLVRSPAVWQATMTRYLQTLASTRDAVVTDAARPASAPTQAP